MHVWWTADIEIADITSFSLENSKHITTGDGGIVVTNNDEFASKMRKFGSAGYASLKATDGRIRRKDIFAIPINDTMRTVITTGCRKLQRLSGWRKPNGSSSSLTEKEIAEAYLEAAEGCDYLVPQNAGKLQQHILDGCHELRTRRCVVARFSREVCRTRRRRDIRRLGASLSRDDRNVRRLERRCPPLYDPIDYPAAGLCPNAEALQPKIMQFVNNDGGLAEAVPVVEALRKTIEFRMTAAQIGALIPIRLSFQRLPESAERFVRSAGGASFARSSGHLSVYRAENSRGLYDRRCHDDPLVETMRVGRVRVSRFDGRHN